MSLNVLQICALISINKTFSVGNELVQESLGLYYCGVSDEVLVTLYEVFTLVLLSRFI